jgi:polyisoprenoid-binding protein YceI
MTKEIIGDTQHGAIIHCRAIHCTAIQCKARCSHHATARRYDFLLTALLLCLVCFCLPACARDDGDNKRSGDNEPTDAPKTQSSADNDKGGSSAEKTAQVKSGLQKGDDVAAWEPIHVTGPEAGTRNCPVCTHLDKPVVLAFAKWTPNAEEIAFMLDQLVTNNTHNELKAFLIVTDGDTETIKQFADSVALSNVSICLCDPKTRNADFQKYKIDPEKENTIIVYRDFTAWSNHVNLQSSDFSTVEDSVTDLMAQPRMSVKKDEVSKITDGKVQSFGDQTAGDDNTFPITSESASVSFSGSSGDGTQDGHFETITGKLTCPGDDPKGVSFEIEIDMNSTKTEYDLLTKHLKSDEFFDVEKFPTANFVSKQIVEGDAEQPFSIVGDMTFHGVTNELTIPAAIEITADQIRIDTEFIIHQSKFGMHQTDSQIADEVPVKVNLAVKRTRKN